jgi:WD40 repeat protein
MPVRAAPLFVLSGHDAAVSCVACSEELDVIASASAGDSTIMVHALRSGRYMRSLTLPAASAPTQLLISDACGSLIVLLQPAVSGVSANSELRAFNCNGMALGVAAASERLAAVALTLDARAVLTGGERGAIVMRNASTLQELARWSGATASLSALCVVADDAVLAGTRDGRVLLWGPQLSADSPRYTRA